MSEKLGANIYQFNMFIIMQIKQVCYQHFIFFPSYHGDLYACLIGI